MTYQKNISSSGSLMYFLEEKSEKISNDTPERKLMYFSDVIPADHIETKLMYFSKKRLRSEEITLAIPKQTNSRNYLALLSFIEDIKVKKSITNMIALSKKMNITNLLLTKIIAYQESNDHEATAPFKDISHAYIIHRFILDIINSALENPENSPIALTYRARQMTASEELTEKSTGLEIPKVGRKFHEGITYADRASTFLTEKSKLYAIMNGIIYRASIGLEYLYNSNIEERKILIKKVDDYNDLFELNRKDIKPVFFGIDKELDPTRYPIDFGIEYRNNLKEITKFIKIRQTLLKDSDGNQYKFDGVFWDGLEPLAVNTSLGFYEGRIVTECDNTISNDKGPIQYNLEIRDFKILVNAEEISESNWTRYINDGEHGQKEKKNLSNIKFFSNGSVITTSIIEPGMEFYTSYGKYYWNSQKKK